VPDAGRIAVVVHDSMGTRFVLAELGYVAEDFGAARADAELFAHARQDILDLCTALDQARAVASRYRREAFNRVARIQPLSSDLNGPCEAHIYDKTRQFETTHEALTWLDSEFDAEMHADD
jgi:hypothetical protein